MAAHQFYVALKGGTDSIVVPITATTIDNTRISRKFGGNVGAQEKVIKDALRYIYQTAMGKAVIEDVMKNDNGISIRFHSTSAYKPATTSVDWNPFLFLWVMDTRKHWLQRGRDVGNFDGNGIVRPPRDEFAYDRDAADYVVGALSPATVLLHELGHRLQHIHRPHYYKNLFKNVGDNFHHLIEDTFIKVHKKTVTRFIYIKDTFKPWETDNVNWHEIPFVRQLRDLGICEGIRWHYTDAFETFEVGDWGLTALKDGPLVIRLQQKDSTTWQHTQCFFKCTPSSKQPPELVHNVVQGRNQKWVFSGMNMGKLSETVFYPDDTTVSDFFTTRKII